MKEEKRKREAGKKVKISRQKIRKKKYEKICNNLIGVNEYLTELGIEYSFDDENEYREILRYLVKKMYKLN